MGIIAREVVSSITVVEAGNGARFLMSVNDDCPLHAFW
ncbi:MAG: hypothetical protein Nkreftii_003785 [Candidatus Nitrospira kreftii]|jgi:hypothetical protein|uniref:Uncharacterized protein n=1 Tax=Candidatus Nitrospira kreftii TaxID=2652173 RepID=A0A7S8FHN2_9BACT|nr:MAG: hypothetical protein Nkreftii_003785 [Candidatus Nitrospira kreftii]